MKNYSRNYSKYVYISKPQYMYLKGHNNLDSLKSANIYYFLYISISLPTLKSDKGDTLNINLTNV